MRLSEAIILGSTMAGHCNNGHLIDDRTGNVCALGAAGLALGAKLEGQTTGGLLCSVLLPAFPILYNIEVSRPCKCPNCESDEKTLHVAIVHLNDFHKWSREQIAEWVASIEPPEQPAEIECLTPDIELVKENQ